LQALRGFNEAPAKLAAILEVLRLVPPETDLPTLEDLLSPRRSEVFNPDTTEEGLKELILSTDASMQALKEFTHSPGEFLTKRMQEAGLSRQFTDYLLAQGGDESPRRYEFVRASRQSLRAIIKGETPDESGSIMLMLPSSIQIDKNGVIRAGLDEFRRAIDGVEAKRIRECEICAHIFWARRITQFGCTPNCAGALRVRRWRERYASTYKFNRATKDKKPRDGTKRAGTKPK
jgi:hypothetical protein